MRLNHFVFSPIDETHWLFKLKRNRDIEFAIDEDSKQALVQPGVIEQWTSDEWLEAMEIHSAVINGAFDHPAIEQLAHRDNSD